jgi:hypothetical protein
MIGEMDSQQKQHTSEFDYGREVERAILHVFVVRREHPMDHPVWRRRVASRPRDIFYLTQETQFSVHRSTSSLPRSWSLRRRLLGNECRQPQQVFDAEVRATGRHRHERIRRRYTRPCCRQVSKLVPVITKADAVLSPSEVLVYELELAPVEGVKDMRNQEVCVRSSDTSAVDCI